MRGIVGMVRTPGTRAALVAVGLVLALPMSCARQPQIDVDHLVCVTDENCPVGRQCIQSRCVASAGGTSHDAADDPAGTTAETTGTASTEAGSAEAGSAEAGSQTGSIDATGPSADSNLPELAVDSGIDVPVQGTGGAPGRDGAGTGGAVDVSGGSDSRDVVGTGGVEGTGGIRGAGGFGQIDAAGGANGSGGALSVDGTTGSGGITGTGGLPATGGVVDSGGILGSGGILSTGGELGSGGLTSTGGVLGNGGITGTGGTLSTGGVVGSGGLTGTGGTPSTGGTTGSGGVMGTGGSPPPTSGPCDIYAAANMPCAAAYSMVRSLSKTYKGPLFQVRAGSSSTNNTMSGGTTADIKPGADGFVDAATVDAACGTGYCTVSVLYDHSGNGNDLKRAPKGTSAGGASGLLDNYESIATKGQVTAGGHRVYSLYMNRTEGYGTTVAGKNMPAGDSQPQGTYELADGTRKASACCWEFGNVTYLPATEYHFADTLCLGHTYWGNSKDSQWFGFGADFEGGVWAGGAVNGDPGWGGYNGTFTTNTANPTMSAAKFALGFLRVNPTTWAIHVADLSLASALTKAWDGGIPSIVTMDHRGGIVLGVGPNNSNNSLGTFYEGAIVSGYPTDDIELAVMTNLLAVGYAR